VIGMAALWFASSESYGRIMNVRFRILTYTGAILVTVMGAGALRSGFRAGFSEAGAVIVLALVILSGKPLSYNAATSSLAPPELLEVPVLDDPNFPNMELQELHRGIEAGEMSEGTPVTVLGVVCRLAGHADGGQVAVMKSYMVCCAADSVAVGVRVEGESFDAFRDGQWLIVRGKLVRLPSPDKVAPFRMGASTFALVNERYTLDASTIDAYDATSHMPLLADSFSPASSTRFKEALLEAGLLETLKTIGPFTVLAPLDSAMGGIDGSELDAEERRNRLALHIVQGRYAKRDLFNVESLTTIDGRKLSVTASNGQLLVESSRIIFADQQARNGNIHIIYPALSGAQP
jgi:uncharacterized surface protein with fasciclin (FAS1) repeats